MKLVTILLSIFVLALPAFALETKDTLTESNVVVDRTECDTSGCDYTGMDVNEQFDNTAGPLRYGPVGTASGCTITDVILSVNIEQTWCGDLVIDLYYDENNDGIMDFGPVSALCRPNLDGCAYDGCCGCSGDLFGVYTFSDNGGVPLGEGDCPAAIEPGCFLPAIESPAGFAATFGGAASGGDFYMEIADGAGGDATFLFDWGVYVCCGSTASENSNWSKVKSDY
ncbi:hypothetical protein H8E52_12755 [bacterium]|nr:hypothetical protein [bacterium]